MEAVIIQHLLSTELALLENELARKTAPSGPATQLLQTHTHDAHMQAQADCKHLEATVQAARCEHAAADAAVYTALQVAQQELREQQELLARQVARQELLRSQEAACHRATLLPPATIAPGMVGRDGGSPSADSTAWSVEDPQALAAVARAFCEALEPEPEERQTALALAAAAAAPNGCQQAQGEAPSSDGGSVPLWSGLDAATVCHASTPLETAQALSEVLAWRSLQMQIGHVADAVSCLQCVPLGSGPAAAGCDATWHAQTAGASARPGTRADFAQSTGAVSAGPDVIRRLRRLNCGAPPPPPRPCRPRHRTSSHPPTHRARPTHHPRVAAAAERSLSTSSALPLRKGAHGKLGAVETPEPARRGRHSGGSRPTLADRSRATANAMPAPAGGPTERVGVEMAMPKAHLVFRPTAAGLRLASEAERTPACSTACESSGPLSPSRT